MKSIIYYEDIVFAGSWRNETGNYYDAFGLTGSDAKLIFGNDRGHKARKILVPDNTGDRFRELYAIENEL